MFHRPGLLLKFTLENGMMDNGQGVGILSGSDIMSCVDDESNDGFVVHKQSGTGLTCMLSSS